MKAYSYLAYTIVNKNNIKKQYRFYVMPSYTILIIFNQNVYYYIQEVNWKKILLPIESAV